MYRNARPERRTSAAAPLVDRPSHRRHRAGGVPSCSSRRCSYLLHAAQSACPWPLTDLLDIRLGFTFSGGAIARPGRAALSRLDALAAGPALCRHLLPGVRLCIRRFNLKTLGREDDASSESGDNAEAERAPAFIRACGAANLEVVDACTTRLRLRLVDRDRASDAQLKALGAMAVVSGQGRPAGGGRPHRPTASPTRSAAPCPSIRNRAKPYRPKQSEHSRRGGVDAGHRRRRRSSGLARRLGGAGNLREVRDVALTRLRVSVADERKLATEQPGRLGGQGVSSSPAASAISWWAPRRGLSQAPATLLRR